MLTTTLLTFCAFLYVYWQKNDLDALKNIGLPIILCVKHDDLPWGILCASLMPWWIFWGFEVGVFAWLAALTLSALIVVIGYPIAPAFFQRWGHQLWRFGVLIALCFDGVSYVI